MSVQKVTKKVTIARKKAACFPQNEAAACAAVRGRANGLSLSLRLSPFLQRDEERERESG